MTPNNWLYLAYWPPLFHPPNFWFGYFWYNSLCCSGFHAFGSNFPSLGRCHCIPHWFLCFLYTIKICYATSPAFLEKFVSYFFVVRRELISVTVFGLSILKTFHYVMWLQDRHILRFCLQSETECEEKLNIAAQNSSTREYRVYRLQKQKSWTILNQV